jgi:glutamine amidotransferase PdxT
MVASDMKIGVVALQGGYKEIAAMVSHKILIFMSTSMSKLMKCFPN